MSELPTTDPVTVIDRLRMRYAIGPMVNGEPEFGWRDMSGPAPEGCVLPTPLMLDAANEIERLQGIYVSAVTGRGDFRKAYIGARQLLKKFIDAWEAVPGHENMDRLCEIARGLVPSNPPSDEPARSISEELAAGSIVAFELKKAMAEVSRLRGMASNCLAVKPTSGMMRVTLEKISGEQS